MNMNMTQNLKKEINLEPNSGQDKELEPNSGQDKGLEPNSGQDKELEPNSGQELEPYMLHCSEQTMRNKLINSKQYCDRYEIFTINHFLRTH